MLRINIYVIYIYYKSKFVESFSEQRHRILVKVLEAIQSAFSWILPMAGFNKISNNGSSFF